MSHVAKIAQWGNSAALRLTSAVMKEARLKVGTRVEIVVTTEGVLFKAQSRPKRLSLTEMIAACNPDAPMPADFAGSENMPAAGQELP